MADNLGPHDWDYWMVNWIQTLNPNLGMILYMFVCIYIYIVYYSILYHIISYHIGLYHGISYHIISYHTISDHMISYHITSYHIINPVMSSYYIISYDIIFYHVYLILHRMTHPSPVRYGAAKLEIRAGHRCHWLPANPTAGPADVVRRHPWNW